MQELLVKFTLIAALVIVNTQNDPCRTCQMILNIAEHYFHNNITDQAALQAELHHDCQRIGQIEGQQALQDCFNTVDQNIDTIYGDLVSGKGITETCYDIGQCTSLTTISQPPHDHPSDPSHTKAPVLVRGQ